MNINYETKFQSDSESSDGFVESITSTSGKTSESLLSAPTLYSDSDVSVKVSLCINNVINLYLYQRFDTWIVPIFECLQYGTLIKQINQVNCSDIHKYIPARKMLVMYCENNFGVTVSFSFYKQSVNRIFDLLSCNFPMISLFVLYTIVFI